MFKIDSRHNIDLFTNDNGIIDFKLCGETLEDGDIVTFITDEQQCSVNKFRDGIAKLYIEPKSEPCNTCYHIDVIMKDGRRATAISGKYIRRGCK